MSDSEPLAASLDEASARLLSMRLRELEARMDKFDGHKAVILSNMERLDIVEVELEGLKKRAAESLPVGVLGKQQDGPATDGEGKAADKCGGIVSSRATGSEGSAGDPMPSFASMSTSGPVADHPGHLVEPPKSALEVLEGLAVEFMAGPALVNIRQPDLSDRQVLGMPSAPKAPEVQGGVAPCRAEPTGQPNTAAPKKRGRKCGECGGTGLAAGVWPAGAPPCPRCAERAKKKNKTARPDELKSEGAEMDETDSTSPETEGVPW